MSVFNCVGTNLDGARTTSCCLIVVRGVPVVAAVVSRRPLRPKGEVVCHGLVGRRLTPGPTPGRRRVERRRVVLAVYLRRCPVDLARRRLHRINRYRRHQHRLRLAVRTRFDQLLENQRGIHLYATGLKYITVSGEIRLTVTNVIGTVRLIYLCSFSRVVKNSPKDGPCEQDPFRLNVFRLKKLNKPNISDIGLVISKQKSC